MQKKTIRSHLLRAATAATLLATLLGGCSMLPSFGGGNGGSSAPAPSQIPGIRLDLTCPVAAQVPAAAYVGPYYGRENDVPLQAMAQDIHCADAFKAASYPGGFVTLYGSSRVRPTASLYGDIRQFARTWTQRYGRRYPIMTGAGPGLMEAANHGAREAGGPSIGYTTYYDPPAAGATPTPARPFGGDPAKAFNGYVSRGLVFSSIAMREQAMIKHSAAMVIAPGGTGTEWELYQIIETIKSRQLAPVPVYILGDGQLHWATFKARLDDMVQRGTLRADEIGFLHYVQTGDELLRQLSADLKL